MFNGGIILFLDGLHTPVGSCDSFQSVHVILSAAKDPHLSVVAASETRIQR